MEIALLTVGDELLAGDTENTNATWLGRRLTAGGASVARVQTVPDDEAVIADAVARITTPSTRSSSLGASAGPPTTSRRPPWRGRSAATSSCPTTYGHISKQRPSAWPTITPDGGPLRHGPCLDAWASVPEGGQALLTDESFAAGCVIDRVYVLPGIPKS